MKITVELPEQDLQEIYEITGIAKKGPAVRQFLADSLILHRRQRIAQKFLTGEWSSALKGYEATKSRDRTQAGTLAESWRD